MGGGRIACLVNGLKAYAVILKKDKLLVVTTLTCDKPFLVQTKTAERVNIKDIGKQNKNAKTLEVMASD